MNIRNINDHVLIQRARSLGKFETLVNTGHTLVSVATNMDRADGPEIQVVRWCYRCNNTGLVRRAADLSKMTCPFCDDEQFMEVKAVFVTSTAVFAASLCAYLSYHGVGVGQRSWSA